MRTEKQLMRAEKRLTRIMNNIHANRNKGPIPEQLWDRAYDRLKGEHGTLLLAYEKVLSQELNGVNWNTISESLDTVIEQKDLAKRRLQMAQLVQAGLKKTEKEANVKKGTGKAIQVVLSAKNMIDLVVQNNPQAALAWTGVSFALQVSSLLDNREYRY